MQTGLGVRTQQEIDDLVNKAQDNINDGVRKFPGMSYEEGIEAVIRWLEDITVEDPMDD